ncbi:hypothetical protein MJT46_013836 [Ovis ammon polii x Ovis aries]|nr:hypothetical protein MJT46_013836 [Ovis ammon polii x Ovis aries]
MPQSKPTHHNYGACALEPGSSNYGAHGLQLLKSRGPRAQALQQEKPLRCRTWDLDFVVWDLSLRCIDAPGVARGLTYSTPCGILVPRQDQFSGGRGSSEEAIVTDRGNVAGRGEAEATRVKMRVRCGPQGLLRKQKVLTFCLITPGACGPHFPYRRHRQSTSQAGRGKAKKNSSETKHHRAASSFLRSTSHGAEYYSRSSGKTSGLELPTEAIG